MAEKLAGYTGHLYLLRSRAVDVWQAFHGSVNRGRFTDIGHQAKDKITDFKEKAINSLNHGSDGDYSHVYRHKSRMELIRVSAAVMGIEFAYAAETAFVSPTLLGIGLQHRHMTLIWCLSPLIGFFLTPLLGSFSDRCRSRLGRRRPFILLLSVGIVLGLLLVPNGKALGIALGDTYPDDQWDGAGRNATEETPAPASGQREKDVIDHVVDTASHPWGILLTVLGTVLLDFDADGCQSPARAYLLDVCLAEDHAVGLSTFTVMAGLGGSLGYAMGAVDWNATLIGGIFGGNVRAVFTLITFIFVGCVLVTLYSFSEIPLDVLADTSQRERFTDKCAADGGQYGRFRQEETTELGLSRTYGTMSETGLNNAAYEADTPASTPSTEPRARTSTTAALTLELAETPQLNEISLRQYLTSIVYMPDSMRWLCLTNLFCWMSLVCYSLYFTDFVGEAVFGGDPKAPVGSAERDVYEQGVRFACWGMAMYSLSCSCYSFVIERLVQRFRAKKVYMGGQLVYTVGMICMAATRHPVGVIVFSWTAGIMYSTLFTMPYLLVAHYHASQVFAQDENGERQASTQLRGLGTDVAVVSSMVFLAQFVLSLSMGPLIAASGTTTATVVGAAVLSFCGCVAASRVFYLDL